MFVGVTAEKLVGGLFAGWGPNLIKTFIKGKSFVAKKFSLGKIFVTWPIFRHFSPPKTFSSDIMKIFDLS